MEGMERMDNLNIEKGEKRMFHFFYYNRDLEGRPVIFECDAPDAVTADNLYEQELHIRPEKGDHIGCSVVKI
jgi:hypothetical protein